MELKDALLKAKLDKEPEQRIIAVAVKSLDNGISAQRVLKNVKIAFQQLAAKGKLSKAGINLYMELANPSFNLSSDLARSSITWF